MSFQFDGALILTHNATSLILQSSVNLTTAAGDVLTFISEGGGNWRELGRRLATPAAGTLVREGGNTTEATTTSTTDVDLLTASSLTINTQLFQASVGIRKTTGAAAATLCGWTLNGTSIFGSISWSSATNEAVNGITIFKANPGFSSYGRFGIIFTESNTTGGVGTDDVRELAADMPTVQITSVISTGRTDNALVTHGADELHVYSYSAT